AEENHWRRGHSERRRVMLGEVIGVKAEPIVKLDQLETVLVKGGEGASVTVEVVEDAEMHGPLREAVPNLERMSEVSRVGAEPCVKRCITGQCLAHLRQATPTTVKPTGAGVR